ncbi:hypothetical protein WJX73_006195 [Symbiochloris irregularis]|uniref:Uncharacterized protein n=1 Tax=Symbiochloris irregularis TaxID=706552 RepID=A0AAW1P875_9CHLO
MHPTRATCTSPHFRVSKVVTEKSALKRRQEEWPVTTVLLVVVGGAPGCLKGQLGQPSPMEALSVLLKAQTVPCDAHVPRLLQVSV